MSRTLSEREREKLAGEIAGLQSLNVAQGRWQANRLAHTSWKPKIVDTELSMVYLPSAGGHGPKNAIDVQWIAASCPSQCGNHGRISIQVAAHLDPRGKLQITEAA
jgi:hypothetical protein